MKNKNLIIGLVVLAIVLLGGGFYFLSQSKTAPQDDLIGQGSQEDTVLTLTAKDLGLTLTPTMGNKRVVLEVANTQDIESLDYELSYLSKGDIPRGAIGHIDIKTKGASVTKEIILGTCSDVCHYDEDVSSVKVLLKITKPDGKVYQAEKSLEF